VTSPQPDPLADTERGADDPIGAFDPDNICGAKVHTYPGEHNQVACLREPHPDGWLHIATCDDFVDYVWRDLSTEVAAQVVVTDDEVAYHCCGASVNTSGTHYAGCEHR
jgi:hypothetical protein